MSGRLTLVIPAKAGIQGSGIGPTALSNLVVQIHPIWIRLLYQFHLPLPTPLFQSLLPSDRALHVRVNLIPDQPMDTISLRKSIDQIRFVLPNPLLKVRSHADVECSIALAGEHVDSRLPFGVVALSFYEGIFLSDSDVSDVGVASVCPSQPLDSGVRRLMTGGGWIPASIGNDECVLCKLS